MSKIDELIAELCPEGVASIPLAAVAKFARGQTITKHTSEYGPFPVIGGGQKPAYWHNVSNRDCCAITVSGSGAYSGFVSRWDVPIWVSDGFSVDPIEDLADGNYIFHFLKARQAELFDLQRGGGVPHVYSKDVAKIMMQLPPLEVQREIVSILDKFTQLEAELEAELEARRSQYEHTRDQLLDFSGDLSHHPLRELIAELCPEGVASPRLDEVFEIRGGFTPPKANPGLWSDGTVPWFRMEDIRENGRVLNGALQNVSEKALKESGAFSANSIIVSTSATIGEHALITVPFLANQRFTVLTIKSGYLEVLLPKFAFYLGFPLSYYCTQNTVKSGFAGVEMVAFRSFPIPLPPLEVQRKIVSILDKLDALVNDLTFGLPAEISARRKQYEYYRNQLLTFKELETA
jgi:type I restriction enzyme S subunit